MFRLKKLLGVPLMLAISVSPNTLFAFSKLCRPTDELLLQAVNVAYEKDALKKGVRASSLSRAISHLSEVDKKETSDALIDALILMLSDDNRTVKIYAAISLEAFGARSESAIPALENAMLYFRAPPAISERSFDPVDGEYEISVVIEEIKKASRSEKRNK